MHGITSIRGGSCAPSLIVPAFYAHLEAWTFLHRQKICWMPLEQYDGDDGIPPVWNMARFPRLIAKSRYHISKCQQAAVDAEHCWFLVNLILSFKTTNLIPSFARSPVAPVLLSLSDPARSTKWNLAVRVS